LWRRNAPSEALEEERAEKISVIGIRLAVAAFSELVTQVFLVSVQEALFLDEVKEHQPIYHDGGIPALHLLVRDALDETEEAGVFGLESLVELLGDFFYIEGFQSPGDAGQSEDILLIQRKDQAVQLLEKQLARLSRGVMIGANRRGLARLLAHPLPYLPAV
jgi:hypothetical protein